MINRIYAYLATAAAILLALFGIHRSGKRQGREETEAENNEEVLIHVQQAKDVENRVHSADDAERDRLRDKWTRP